MRESVYPTTEREILETRPAEDGLVSEEDGLGLVLWACDELEAQVSCLDHTPEEEPADVS